MRDFGLGKRDEAPIVRPGIVEDADNDLGVAVKMLELDLADADPGVALARLHDALDQRREGLGDIDLVSHQRLGQGIAIMLDPALILRLVMPHHHRGRVIVALGQQARFFPDRQAERRERAGHALAAQPVFGRRDQGVRRSFIFGLEQAPIAGARAHPLCGRLGQREVIDVGRNAPDHRIAAPREEQLHRGVFVERVLARGEQFGHFAAQRRDPVGV